MIFFTEVLPRDACSHQVIKRNPNHSSFRQFCAAVCSQKLVTQEDYHVAVDWYCSLARGGNSCARKINYRYVQVVSLKYRRTSFLYANNEYPRSAVMALQSHNCIISRITAGLQDAKSCGGRSGTHLFGRYYNPLQGEFFKKRLASVKSARALVSSYLTNGSLNSSEVVQNVRS